MSILCPGYAIFNLSYCTSLLASTLFLTPSTDQSETMKGTNGSEAEWSLMNLMLTL